MSLSCSNLGHYDRWTCPKCYQDMPTKRPGTFTCDFCGAKVACTRETSPVCVATIEDDGDAEFT